MRKWQNLAAPDDPNSWFDVLGMFPTSRGTYKTINPYTETSASASGATDVSYAFAANTLSSTVEWVVDTAKIWLYSAGTYTDKTNGVTVGSYPHMAQYGNVTICAMGAANATIASTSGGNWAAISGAPNGEIVVVQSNAVLIFNTNTSTDGWAASDVGDYTNWTTGEAASGRLIATPGPVTAAVAFGGSVYAFKTNAIYRLTYVGGPVKWAVELVRFGLGCSILGTAETRLKYSVASSGNFMLFVAPGETSLTPSIWLADGASGFQLVNPLTSIGVDSSRVFCGYLPGMNLFWVYNADGRFYHYNPTFGMWSRSVTSLGSTEAIPITGVMAGLSTGEMPIGHGFVGTNLLARYTRNSTATGASSSVQTAMIGRADAKTCFKRVVPLLRSRSEGTSPSSSLQVKLYAEMHGAATRTENVTESSALDRFDFLYTDRFARFAVTYSNIKAEVDDFLVATSPAGTE